MAETKQNEASSSASGITPAALREAIQQIRSEPSPTSPEEQEHYFMAQVATGEKLALEGAYTITVTLLNLLILNRSQFVSACCYGFLPCPPSVSFPRGTYRDLRKNHHRTGFQGAFIIS